MCDSVTVRIVGRTPHPSALNAARRARELARLGDDPHVDVLVIGGGITGVGIALDAASRGLRTVLVEKHDLAWGTSRWSSKLVHGGLRYLATGQFALAHESAAERHLLMTRLAPHLTRPLAQIVPLYEPDHARRRAVIGTGYALGDGLRRTVGTPRSVLPAPRALDRVETLRLAPSVRADGLRGGVRGWDGQLVDDARLVVAVARTAAGFGASVLTCAEALSVDGDGAVVRDALTEETLRVHARAVISAAGVWAGSFDPALRLRPSRGTHLVVAADRIGADASLTVPVPGSTSRFVFTLPAVHGRAYIGLTDVAADGPIPDVPEATDAEVGMLLDVVNSVLAEPLTRADVLGTFAGLRPLLAADGTAETSDLSRRHAIVESGSGMLSVVGGKLTTYRRMAEDAVDEAIRRRALPTARASVTSRLPLVGAWARDRLSEIPASARLVRRYGAEAPYVASLPDAAGAACGVTAQELEWGARVEGALSVDDLLDRRTRLGLVAADRAASEDAAAAALARARGEE